MLDFSSELRNYRDETKDIKDNLTERRLRKCDPSDSL